jgi:hypothetical protein
MRTDRQTDTTKLIFAFRNFANTPNDILIFSNNFRKILKHISIKSVVPCGRTDRQTDTTKLIDPGSVHVGFVLDKVALGQVFPPSTSVFPCQFHSTGAPLIAKAKKTSSSSSQGCTISLKAAVRPYHLLRGPSIKKNTSLPSNVISYLAGDYVCCQNFRFI